MNLKVENNKKEIYERIIENLNYIYLYLRLIQLKLIIKIN